MGAVSLSRWTMSYFAAALFFLIAAETLMSWGYGYPHAALQAPQTLILVHIIALGWLSLLMCGALFQFLPVLIAQPLYSNMLPLPTLAFLAGGLVALILGFLQLGGQVDFALPCFPAAAALLGSGFALVVWNLARTLWRAKSWALPARFVIVSLVSIVAGASFGIIFVLVLSGSAVSYGPFVTLTNRGLPLHIVAALGGWLTFAAMGVSYRLLAMFMLAPELERPSTKAVLYLGAGALGLAIVGGLVILLLHGHLGYVLEGAGGMGLVALTFYGRDMLTLYQARRRRQVELNSRMAAVALGSLGVAVALTIAFFALGELANKIGAVIFLIAFGWLTGLGLAQLYKIVAFLSWLECYGPVLGKAQTPRVQDLVVERRAAKWFWLYFLAVWVGTIALVVGYPLLFQISAVGALVATSGVVVELVQTRRLANVEVTLRLPPGAHQPRLLFSPAH